MHHDQAPPVDQTLRRCTQPLGDLFEQGHALVEVLIELIVSAVDTYIAALPSDLEHPFLGRRPAPGTGQQGWRFTDSWFSRLNQSGFHTNHVHPHGWLSSAHYVQVPPSFQGSPSTQGWLQCGQPDFDAGLIDPVRLRVPPSPGRLVLFPSMFWHGAMPFDEDAERLTIAFDVVPAV